MFCKYCGKELADTVKFCSKSGKKLVTETDTELIEYKEFWRDEYYIREIKIAIMTGR